MNTLRNTRRTRGTRIAIATIAACSLLAACGGDEDSGGGRDEVVDQFVEAASADGATVDEACVREVVAKLPDADVEKIVEAGPDGDADVSAEAEELGFELIECVEDFGDLTSVDPSDASIPEGVEITDAMVDLMVEQIEASGVSVDRDCIGEALEGMDLAEAANGAMTPEMMQSFAACIEP